MIIYVQNFGYLWYLIRMQCQSYLVRVKRIDIPNVWRVAKVILLFKKGDATLPQNYRPISLLPVGYKVLATLIHQRLLDNGVDSEICRSQYGFRPHRSCCDALMVIRRMIDAAHESKHEGPMLVFLDWAKVFDRIRN